MRGETILIWPEDVQFIVAGDWMVDCVEVLANNPWIGSMGLNAIRRQTIERYWGPRRWLRTKKFLRDGRNFGTRLRHARAVLSSAGFPSGRAVGLPKESSGRAFRRSRERTSGESSDRGKRPAARRPWATPAAAAKQK